MKVLFIAADPMEYTGLVRRASAVRPTAVSVDWARKARLNGDEIMLIANGIGPERAAAGTEAGIGALEPDLIVNTGYCGALAPELQIADIVIADRIVGGRQVYAARPPKALNGSATGPIRSISYVAATAAQKRELASEGAIAVEMEAAGVAETASRYSIPFYCIRAVTDLAGETMANDFNKALRADGHFDTMIILRVALLDPATRIPELFRLRKRCSHAARALGDFFADNRF
jgi:adenosylhomocysteine nucleosidase